jgi:hypothetical protein
MKKLLTITERRPMCSTCHDKAAWLGERECGDCLIETKLSLWLQSEHAQPGEWAAPWAMSVDEALRWASGGVVHAPRIQEVPPAPVRETFWDRLPLARPLPAMVTVAHFKSVVRWMGLGVLLALTAGWLFGRFGC